MMVPDRSSVRRVEAERHLRYMLICFAATVITARWFLSVTGYPRLGGGELHCQRMACPVRKGAEHMLPFSLRQRVRPRSELPAKMEIRATCSS